jgi:hypothetical protein
VYFALKLGGRFFLVPVMVGRPSLAGQHCSTDATRQVPAKVGKIIQQVEDTQGVHSCSSYINLGWD